MHCYSLRTPSWPAEQVQSCWRMRKHRKQRPTMAMADIFNQPNLIWPTSWLLMCEWAHPKSAQLGPFQQNHPANPRSMSKKKKNYVHCYRSLQSCSVQISRSVVSDSLRPHGLQHARPPCPSPTPRVYSNSCPLSWWCHPTISSSVVPFSSHFQSFPALGSFQMSHTHFNELYTLV